MTRLYGVSMPFTADQAQVLLLQVLKCEGLRSAPLQVPRADMTPIVLCVFLIVLFALTVCLSLKFLINFNAEAG
jgi:hypothetical protein